jgi:WD40 repeat protein
VHDDHLILHPDTPHAERVALDVFNLLGGKAGFVGGDVNEIRRKAALTFVPRCSDVSSDGSLIAIGFATIPPDSIEVGRLAIFDRKEAKLLWFFRTKESAPASVRFSGDGSLVAVGTTRVRVFYSRTGVELATFDGHRGAIKALAFDAEGKRLVSGSEDTTAMVWRIKGR